MSARRVVVTGLGVVHALGQDVASLLDALSAGDQPLEPGDVAACEQFDPDQLRESPKTYMDRCADLLLGACYLAVRQLAADWQGLEQAGLDPERCGVSIGTAYGPTDSMLNMTARVQQKGLRFGSPMIFTHTFVNAPASLVSIEYGMFGPCMTHVLGEQSSAAALAYARDLISLGRADLMLVGGVEALSQPLLSALDVAAPEVIPGEGAAVLILEAADHALSHGRAPLAELAGAICLAPGAPGAAAAALAQAGLAEADLVRAPAACGHNFGAAVALAAACCVGKLVGGEPGPLAAATQDDSAAVVFREWV